MTVRHATRTRIARVSQGLLGAAIAALVASGLDARWASYGSESAEGAGVGLVDTALVDAGLLLPLAMVVGLLVGLATAWLWPERPPRPAGLVLWLRGEALGRPADVAAYVPLAVLACFLWTTATAHMARLLLAMDATPIATGVAMATGTALLGLLSMLGILSLVPLLRRALATASTNTRRWVDPVFTGGLMTAVVVVLFTFGVSTGSLAGDGGALGIYGVLRRPELDLRGPLLLLSLVFGTLLGPLLFARARAWVAVALAVVPLLLTVRASSVLNDRPELSLAIERGAPLGKQALAPLRRAWDRDGDGRSGQFGGGDCNDADPSIHPSAQEILDNGIDEDCSGSDLTQDAVANLLAEPVPPPPTNTRAFPEDLNIVLITIDTLRWDIGYNGNPRPVSPNIDKLASKGTAFERAYSLASYTGKSIGPMLIGKYGSETHRNWGHFNKFSEEDTFVAQRLQAAGYHTMAVHAHRYFDVWGGLERGFDVLDMTAAPPKDARWDVDNKATGEVLTDAALALLNKPETADKPFFLWVHYLDPHADYLIHDDPDLPDFGRNSQRDLYDGEVAYTDKQVGRILDRLDQAPFAEKTAIIITSDHGEAFGEHGMHRHGFEIWDVLVRVPLVVYVPQSKPSRVRNRRSLIDLVPTILELSDIDLPEPKDMSDPNFVSGRSLVRDAFATVEQPSLDRDVLVDMPAGKYNGLRRALIHDDLKLTVSDEKNFELYDLAADPGEEKNLARTDADRLTSMKERYAAFKSRLREVIVKPE